MEYGIGKKLLAALGVMALLLAACGPAATATPTTTMAVATATPKATATPAPGTTPTLAPTATPGPAPKATPATAGPKYGGVLRHRVLDDVESWDPGRFFSFIGEMSLWVYPRLFTFYRGTPGVDQCRFYPIQPELAAGFKWVDDTTLDVSIRQGVRLPQRPPLNGREVTADDVVFTFNRYFFGTKLNPLLAMANVTQSVTKLDKYTARFKLKSPHAEYVELALTYHDTPILPPETLEPPGDPTGQYTLESYKTGAYGRFRLSKWSPAVSTELERNPDFFIKGLPYLDGVSLKVIPDDSTFLAALRGGRLDSGLTRAATTIANVNKLADLPMEVCSPAQTSPAFMNLNRPELQDVNVRRAISMAIDREALNKVVYNGLAGGAYSIITPTLGPAWAMELADYPPEVRRWLTYDVKGARELLAKAGHPSGITIKLTYWPQQGSMAPAAEALSAMLDDAGINVKLDAVPRDVYVILVTQFPWDKPDTRYTGLMMGLKFWTSVDDLYTYAYSKSARNQSVIKDPKLDQMVEEQRRTLDVTKRQKLAKDIQAHIVNQMYIIPLPIGPHAEIHQPYVKGIYFKTYGWYDGEPMRDVWLDK